MINLKEPYPYQEALIKETSKAVFVHKDVLLQAPPGAGKTVIMQNMIYRGLKKGSTFLVLIDATNIYPQLVREFSAIEINADVKSLYIREGFCYVAMAQTLKKRPVILEQFKRLGGKLIVMTDEAHIDTATPLLLALEQAKKIGLTATPYYSIAPFLPKIYKALVHGPQVEELIQLRKLSNVRHLARTRGNLSLLQMRNGDYTEQSQDEVFNSKNVYDGLFDDLKEVPYNKCIIFVASKKSADALNQRLNENGFPSVVYHSSIENRNFELAKFTELNLVNILVTIKSLSKGWDFKPIDLVVLNHKTTSPATYDQEVGRGSRVIPGIKENFTVLDYGDNWKQHGLFFENKDFNTLWNQQPKSKKERIGVDIKRLCPICDSILPSSIRLCPYCNHEFPIEEKPLEIGNLVDITKEYKSLAGKKVSELDPFELSIYVKTLNKKPYGARVARAREQTEEGYLLQYARHMGYKDSWSDYQRGLLTDTPVEFMDLELR